MSGLRTAVSALGAAGGMQPLWDLDADAGRRGPASDWPRPRPPSWPPCTAWRQARSRSTPTPTWITPPTTCGW